MKLPDHVYVFVETYTCHTNFRHNKQYSRYANQFVWHVYVWTKTYTWSGNFITRWKLYVVHFSVLFSLSYVVPLYFQGLISNYCVLSGRCLCEELITRPEESYRLCCVVVCDLETSWMRGPWPTGGLSRQKQTNDDYLPAIVVLLLLSMPGPVAARSKA
jgi:hypothetical protein